MQGMHQPTDIPIVPYVVKQTSEGERAFDIYSRLLEDRIVFLGEEVTASSANLAIAQLLHLDSQDTEKPISMYINSPGGSVYAGLGLLDTMQFVKAPVYTICVGYAASMASVLLAAGEPGHRYILPNSVVMIHQPSSGVQGQQTDIQIVADETRRIRTSLNQLLADFTGQDFDKVEQDTERDNWLTAEDALAYGLVDEVMRPSKR